MKKEKEAESILVLGKFMPPHKGHEALINFAKENLKFRLSKNKKNEGKVYVVVDRVENEIIPNEIRAEFLREDIGNIEVIALTKYMPQSPDISEEEFKRFDVNNEYQDFWDMWKSEIVKQIGMVPTVVVASETYGEKLALLFSEELSLNHKDKNKKCDFMLFDLHREGVDISATKIRNQTEDNFDFLLPSAKAYFAKRICFLGAENTGKTTLAKQFAKILNTQYVPEYAEGYIKNKGYFEASDAKVFIENQILIENALAKNANNYLFCDSCYLSTKVFFNSTDLDKTYLNEALNGLKVKVNKLKPELHYDLFIVMEPNRDDEIELLDENGSQNHRGQLPNKFIERKAMHDEFVKELKEMKANYIILNRKNNYLVKSKENLEFFLKENLK